MSLLTQSSVISHLKLKSIICFLYRVRLNYFLGGMAAGAVFGSWARSVPYGGAMGLFFGKFVEHFICDKRFSHCDFLKQALLPLSRKPLKLKDGNFSLSQSTLNIPLSILTISL